MAVRSENPVGCATVLLAIAMFVILWILIGCSEKVVTTYYYKPLRGIEVKCDTICNQLQ